MTCRQGLKNTLGSQVRRALLRQLQVVAVAAAKLGAALPATEARMRRLTGQPDNSIHRVHACFHSHYARYIGSVLIRLLCSIRLEKRMSKEVVTCCSLLRCRVIMMHCEG